MKSKAAFYASAVLMLVASYFATTSSFVFLHRPETPKELLK
jgi:cyclic lactone autoinducer peptide